MMTVKQLADELGINKQRVYRYIKKCITGVHHDSGVIYLNETQVEQVKQHFTVSDDAYRDAHHDVSSDAVMMQYLMKQNEDLMRQVETLQRLLDQEQQLHAATRQELKALEAPKAKRRWKIWERV